MLKAAIFAAVMCVVLADIVVFRDCGSKSGTVVSVNVTPCPTEPCQFQRETNVSFTIDFIANVEITSARTVVYGIILGVKVPFPVPDNACNNMPCPVAPGSKTTYTNAIFIQKVYPLVSLVAQYEIHDQDDNLIVCINVPAQIVN